MNAPAYKDPLKGSTLVSRSERAFTLIELLITISIIGVMLAVSINAVTGMQKSSRDAQRRTDLRIIQSALERYKADQHYYPSATFPWGEALREESTLYLDRVPHDPSRSNAGTVDYCYEALPVDCGGSSPCTSYILFTKLERSAQEMSPCVMGSYACRGSVSDAYNCQVNSP